MNSTQEQQALLKHLSNRVRRIQTLYWIEDAYGKKVKFRMNWAQTEFLAGMWYMNMILKVRQIGMSTFMGLLQLDRCLFAKNQTCGIVDKTDDDAKKKLSKIEFAYNHLDDPDDPSTAALGAAIKQAVRLMVANKRELEWSNGSKIWAGTSLRGSAVNWLHVSELGPIAYKYPEKAKEIAAGSFNTVHRGNIITVESTHEGGRYGLNYNLIREAQGTSEEGRTEMDWKFFFFPWWKEPKYTLPLTGPLRVSVEHARYFAQLEKQCRISLTDEQKHWYGKKAKTPDVNMAQQFPGTAEEAMQAITAGSIYGKEIAELRGCGRVCSLRPDGTSPFYTFWDIGCSDYTCVWLLQFIAMDFVAIDYYTAHGNTTGQSAAAILEWEAQYQRPISMHYLPHDANNRGVTGITYVDELKKASSICGHYFRAFTLTQTEWKMISSCPRPGDYRPV
jgi:hypothetical protein